MLKKPVFFPNVFQKKQEKLFLHKVVIYELTGESLGTMGLGLDSVEISLGFSPANRDARKTKSCTGDVAIDPNLLTEDRADLSFEDHVARIAELNSSQEIPEAIYRMGTAADYVELIIQHFKETGQVLCGDNKLITASLLNVDGPVFAVVHGSINDGKLTISVDNCAPNKVKDPSIISVPLIMPKTTG